MKRLLVLLLTFIISAGYLMAADAPEKKVLVLVEGDYSLKSIATAEGRQVAQLLGHFNTAVTVQSVNTYKLRDINKYDIVFYVGTSVENQVPAAFENDVYTTTKPVVWINSGFVDFSRKFDLEKRFGFNVSKLEENIPFSVVKAGKDEYSKGDPATNLIQIKNKTKVEVWATAVCTKPKKETPYMVKSGNLIYIADIPMIGATETDRYLLFSDKLHDILGENHSEAHQAIIRIEDVTPLNDPDKLREVADILAERGIPFIVGVVPIYVNPSEDRRVTLTDRPELVDALKYMVRNGGNIVMHGVTHQYTGVSTDDAEFWNYGAAKPIPDETTEDITKKIESGLDEFFKNGLYPIAWETPHYVASVKSYQTFAKFFSTAVEQRMVIDNFDYGQYFPYTINKDIYGQKIYPENLGYVPFMANIDSSRVYVNRIIKNSESIHKVRDGIVSFFFHPFLNLSLLRELTDGIKAKGFSFIDISNNTNWVKGHDKVILTGTQSYKLTLDNTYLHEIYYDKDGNPVKKIYSPDRITGDITKTISLSPGAFYIAEAVDYHIKEPTFKDKILQTFRTTYDDLFGDKNWHQAKVKICWNQYARGAAYNDQSSLAAIFKNVNINIDTLFVGQELDLSNCNLLVVPYPFVDSLTYFDKEKIARFVKKGGNLITDRKNKLAQKFGFKFLANEMKLHAIRDKNYPLELINWKFSQLTNKFDYEANDEIFCEDVNTGLPVVIGRSYNQGKIIYFNTAFDPNSQLGYSCYPYAMEYVKRYFQLYPILKRENLEFYFEPSDRKNTSIENIVKLWVKQGIRIVHIGGWHQYAKYTYDYDRLIKVAHTNGILVYLWIEPPYVSEKFWKAHPEWREKNYKNQDINGDINRQSSWRLPVALTDANCLKAVIDEYTKMLKEFDWDGVNVAELHFEAGDGFKQPQLFAPFHPSACKEFKLKYGFDLKQIFDSTSVNYWRTNPKAKEAVVNYRVDKVTYFHDVVMKNITEFAKTKNGFGVIVTILDNYFSPEIRENLGSSADRIIALQKKYGFLLQAEDPMAKWSTDPSRYLEMGRFYSQKMGDASKLMLDLNIMKFRDPEVVTPFPTTIQTGAESNALINFAAEGAPRFTIYSEGSCRPHDLAFFSYASSSPVKYSYTEDGIEVKSPYSFVLQLPKDIKIISIDDESVVGYRENNFLVPAGEHSIKFHTKDFPGFTTVEIQPQLLSFTGNLLSIDYGMRQVKFNYESIERALVTINRKPTSVKVDGQDFKFEVLTGNDCFSVFLPVGKHDVEIETGDQFTYGMNITSLWSITAIAIYGTVAVILLVLMYFGLKLFRRKLEN
jgi:Uncharacterized protein conserved in bacteria (DUF2334).